MFNKSYKSILGALLLVVAAVLPSGIVKADGSSGCQSTMLPVTLSQSDPTVYHLYGELCGVSTVPNQTVQLLVHGYTYDHTYWDFPLQPGIYSYVQHAIDEGYATFNIDRIGSGLSDHPLSTLLTISSNAFVLHQIVTDLRSGAVEGNPFAKVLTVGHSFGSDIAMVEASTYADVDGLIMTGFLHQFNASDLPSFESSLYPAQLDPKFAASGLDSGYLTTVPGTRGSDFYNTSVADPAVIAKDELLKQTGTVSEQSTAFATLAPSISQAIHIPVLLAVGQYDALFCNASLGLPCDNSQEIVAREAADYSPQTCLEAFTLPTSGHDMNLNPNARDWYKAANQWVNRRIGSDATHPASDPCTS